MKFTVFVDGQERTTGLKINGKGSFGAAIQNMNIMLGVDEGLGL